MLRHLSSDIMHAQRPDGRDLDCLLHVNPRLPEKGLVLFCNPLAETITRKIRLPRYYTGLSWHVIAGKPVGSATAVRVKGV